MEKDFVLNNMVWTIFHLKTVEYENDSYQCREGNEEVLGVGK